MLSSNLLSLKDVLMLIFKSHRPEFIICWDLVWEKNYTTFWWIFFSNDITPYIQSQGQFNIWWSYQVAMTDIEISLNILDSNVNWLEYQKFLYLALTEKI